MGRVNEDRLDELVRRKPELSALTHPYLNNRYRFHIGAIEWANELSRETGLPNTPEGAKILAASLQRCGVQLRS